MPNPNLFRRIYDAPPQQQQQKMRPTNSVIYGTLRNTLQAIRYCASYILLNRLGLGINSEFLCH